MHSENSTTHADGDLSGQRLGGYRLVRRLGSGAMADVYLAEQESLGRQVAVKVLRPETLRHPSAVQRFSQEARAAAALVHGNIVQIHEVACIDGIYFLAEEYVAGPTLKAWLASRGPLDARQSLVVLAHVGSALARSAEQGVVHRDIKPENLLVTPSGEVKVADFGLARVLATADGLDLTQDGMTLGTPLYMSPEQAEGKAVDSRSDLYSLGATVYHLLAGRPPFLAATSLAVALAHIKELPVPIAEVRPDVPVGLSDIIDRLLCKRPADRFVDPTELLHAVEAVETAIAPGSRHMPSPLSWSGDGNSFAGHAGGFGRRSDLSATVMAHTGPMWAHARTIEAREATGRLQSAMDLEQQEEAKECALSRRFWLATGAVAGMAMVAGFAIGRSRPSRSTLFRSTRQRR
jgi:serine/threonine protein kinase